jgi:anti-anti-sigma factor
VGLTVTKHGTVHVLHLSGALKTGPNLDEFSAEFDRLVTAGYSRFVLEMSQVPHIDSNGVGMLVRVYSASRNRAGGVRLVNPTSGAIDVMKTVCLWNLFEISDSEEAAVAALTPKTAASV